MQAKLTVKNHYEKDGAFYIETKTTRFHTKDKDEYDKAVADGCLTYKCPERKRMHEWVAKRDGRLYELVKKGEEKAGMIPQDVRNMSDRELNDYTGFMISMYEDAMGLPSLEEAKERFIKSFR
jgi:hypothetical protein